MTNKNKMANAKEAIEMLNLVVENYKGENTKINSDFVNEVREFLKKMYVLEKFSNSSYGIKEVSFCGAENKNKVTILFNNLSTKTTFSLVVYENGEVTVISHIMDDHYKFNDHNDLFTYVFGLEHIFKEKRQNISYLFEPVAEKVFEIIHESKDLRVKWYNKQDSMMMIETNDGKPYFIIKGVRTREEKGNRFVPIVEGRKLDGFTWEYCPDFDLNELFMFTQEFAEKAVE